MDKIVTYLFLAIGLTMFIFTVLLSTARKRTSVTRWLGAYILGVGYVWFYYGLYRATGLARAPWLVCSDIVMELIAGPALLFYTRSLLGSPPRRRPESLMPFLPAAAFLAYLALARPGRKMPATMPIGTNPSYFWDLGVSILNALADCYFFSLATISTIIVAKALKAGSRQFRAGFRGLLVYYLAGSLTLVGFVAAHLLRSEVLLGLSVLAEGVYGTYLFFFSYRYPENTQRELRFANAALQVATPARADGTELLGRLRKLIEVDKEYRDPELSLQALSTKLGVQNHQLSQLLHEGMGTSFRSYINHNRLEEAKRLLLEARDMSILDIAFGVGFNSKSAFNAAFMNETGLSPSEFRKKQAQKT